MDPDATLAEIHEHLKKFRAEYDLGEINALDTVDAAVDLADSVAALLEWLAKGGFSPDWKRVA